jgi:hypothetical protein
VLHGAIGQVFYKKLVASWLWGGVQPLGFFPAYCAIVLLAAAGVQKLFLVGWGAGWGWEGVRGRLVVAT